MPVIPPLLGAQAVDPVCGAVVDPDHASRAAYDGIYHFCSLTCRERFVADPRRFVVLTATGRRTGVALSPS